MAFNKVTTYEAEVNFLESEVGLVLKTHTANATNAVLDEVSGRKLIKAGSVYPANDSTAIGIVFQTEDMTNDAARPISVMEAGRVYENRLAVSVDSDAKEALEAKGIVFVTATTPVFE